MKNYTYRIELGNGKFAYDQAPQFRISGENIIGEIRRRWKPPSTFYHLQKGGHVAAILKHSHNSVFSRFDVSRFFFRVKKNMIIKALKSIGFSFLDANQIAQETVVWTEEGLSLPYGFVQSPIIASLCLDKSHAGIFLRRLPRDLTLSVYVDDIILSHSQDARRLEASSRNLLSVFSDSGFPISEEKCEICRTEITSFNIRVSRGALEITPERMEQFEINIKSNYGNDRVVAGIINYVKSVNPSQADQLSKSLVE